MRQNRARGFQSFSAILLLQSPPEPAWCPARGPAGRRLTFSLPSPHRSSRSTNRAGRQWGPHEEREAQVSAEEDLGPNVGVEASGSGEDGRCGWAAATHSEVHSKTGPAGSRARFTSGVYLSRAARRRGRNETFGEPGGNYVLPAAVVVNRRPNQE